MREQINLGGFPTWIEVKDSCTILLFGSATAKHGKVVDVMGDDGKKYIPDGYMLTEQEKKELGAYLNKK